MAIGDADDRAENWAVIAQAEGILSARYNITVFEAAQLLTLDAVSSQRPVSQIARDVRTRRSIERSGTSNSLGMVTGREWDECGGGGE